MTTDATIQVRTATPDDALGVATVNVRSWQVAYRGVVAQRFLDEMDITARAEIWRQRIEKTPHTCLVAVAGDDIIGYSFFGVARDTDLHEPASELWALYVLPEWWSHGVGRALWAESKKLLEQRSASLVTLRVMRDNPRARRFYEIAGFVLDGSEMSVTIGEQEYPIVRYRMQLAQHNENDTDAEMDIAASDAWCRRLALGHYENFPVGSVLIPKPLRKHFYAVYAFSRIADDIADEGTASVEERLAQLHELEALVHRPQSTVHRQVPSALRPLSSALHRTMRECSLPQQPFLDLLEAFRRDIQFTPPRSMGDLLDYCRYSANPVGELVLRICGAYSEEAKAYSDDICTALQLVNFVQDISVDTPRGRHYISDATPLQEVMDLTDALFKRGGAITSCNSVHAVKVFGFRFLVFELNVIRSAGQRILAKCRANVDTLHKVRPHLTPLDYLFILARA